MTTLLAREAREAPRRVDEALTHHGGTIERLAERLRAEPPGFCLTVARGSSDHAAGYARYMIETFLGTITASAAPSVVTHYHAPLSLRCALVLAFSQSGTSPDVVETVGAARGRGALTVALVNAMESALATRAEITVDLRAGAELSIAATKSFIAMLAVTARLVGHWRRDRTLLEAVGALPAALEASLACDWSSAIPMLAPADRVLVVARGRTLPIAQEMALKLKEVARLHAEPFSAAELMHGPVALIEPGFPVLVVATRDETYASVDQAIRYLREMGARVLVAEPTRPGSGSTPEMLPLPPPLHPALDPIVAVQAFYPFVSALAEARGLDPDRPSHLAKITRTY